MLTPAPPTPPCQPRYWNRQYRKAIKRVGRVHPEMSMDEVYVAAYETLQVGC